MGVKLIPSPEAIGPTFDGRRCSRSILGGFFAESLGDGALGKGVLCEGCDVIDLVGRHRIVGKLLAFNRKAAATPASVAPVIIVGITCKAVIAPLERRLGPVGRVRVVGGILVRRGPTGSAPASCLLDARLVGVIIDGGLRASALVIIGRRSVVLPAPGAVAVTVAS